MYYVALPDNVDNNNEQQQQQRIHGKRLRKDVSRHLTSEPKEVRREHTKYKIYVTYVVFDFEFPTLIMFW